MPDEMNAAEQLVAVKMLLLAASLIKDLDLERLRKSIESSEGTWEVFDTSTASYKTKEHLLPIVRGAQAFKNALAVEERNDGG